MPNPRISTKTHGSVKIGRKKSHKCHELYNMEFHNLEKPYDKD